MVIALNVVSGLEGDDSIGADTKFSVYSGDSTGGTVCEGAVVHHADAVDGGGEEKGGKDEVFCHVIIIL